MKKITVFLLCIFLLIPAFNCLAENGNVDYNAGGLKVSIPEDIADKLVVELPENSERGYLISVSEKASIEAAKAEGYTWNGAGWLFSIGTMTEEQYHEAICEDMTGFKVFAKDNNGVYYMYYHPTDVRLVREGNAYDEENLKAWGDLNEWANSMTDKIIADNGLTPEKHGNTILDIYLARMFYRDNVNYTVSTTQYGPKEPKGVKAADYIEPLVNGAVFTPLNDEEAPDSEYVVLNFPEDNIRFDFFFMEGKENYIRQVWSNDEYEMLYKAEFEDESLKASEIMNNLYLDMVLADSLGYTPDDMVGVWAEKIAGRCTIEISKAEEDGKYNVKIHWGSSAFESYNWSMTAVSTGNGAELRYEDCTLIDLVFTSEEESTETVVYEKGTGTFNLLSTYELVWNDETGHAADDTVFISVR